MKNLVMLTLFLSSMASAQVKARSDEERVTMETAKKVSSSVVTLQIQMEDFSSGVKETVQGTGSGVVIDSQGHVLTNFHVAGRATKITVTMLDGEKIGADLVGADPYTDLAVVKLHLDELNGTTFTWASLGDSDQMKVGHSVLAVGAPMGLKQTVTKGIVSNNHRYISGDRRLPSGEKTGEFNHWIQTDTAVNPGNSGGPLVNNKGEIIGINTLGGSGDGLGFAIPINVAKDVARQILSGGRVVRSWSGLSFQPMEQFARFLKGSPDKGILVSSVVVGSPADRAGVRTGDVLLSWNGKGTNARFKVDIPAIRKRLADTPLNTKVELKILRGGEEKVLELTTEELESELSPEREIEGWRCAVRGMTRYLARARKLDTVAGALVIAVDDIGPAHRADLRVGDLIVKANDTAVVSVADLLKVVKGAVEEEDDQLLLTIRRGRGLYLAVVNIESAEGK